MEGIFHGSQANDWRRRLGYPGHRNGRRLTFRWYSRPDKYLGLDEDELSLRIIVKNESQRASQWKEWNKKILANNGTMGVMIKTSRFQAGERMKVAVLDSDYRKVKPDGLLDLDRTVETIRKAKALMEAALEL